MTSNFSESGQSIRASSVAGYRGMEAMRSERLLPVLDRILRMRPAA